MRLLSLLVRVAALSCILVISSIAASSIDEEKLLFEKQTARRRADAGVREVYRLNKNIKSLIDELDRESTAARQTIDSLTQEMLGAMTRDDPVLLKAIQTSIEANQVRLDAASNEKSLALKRIEETERDRDVMIRRSVTMEFALKLEMRVMLATADEVESRDTKVEEARQDVDNQIAQIRKYASRRASAYEKYCDLLARVRDAEKRRKEFARLIEGGSEVALGRWRSAMDDEVTQRRRAVKVQQEWIILNKLLEDRARRNLAFARAAMGVATTYAGALARKAAVHQAGVAQLAADQVEASVAGYRKDASGLQKKFALKLDAERAATEAALAAMGAASDYDSLSASRSVFDGARLKRDRTEAALACFEEMQDYQKACVAFAREKADRARSLAVPKNMGELTQEIAMRNESARTSEQYVYSLRTIAQKLDRQIEADLFRLPTNIALADVRAGVMAMVVPPTGQPQLSPSQVVELVERAGSLQVTGETAVVISMVLYRSIHQRLIRERLQIAMDWLEGTRAFIHELEKEVAVQLWRQRDHRLAWNSIQEIATLGATVISDVQFAWDNLKVRFIPLNGSWLHLARIFAITAIFLLVALLIRRAPESPLQWFTPKTILVLALSSFVVQLVQYLFPWGTKTLFLIDSFYICFVLWYLVRRILLLICPGHRWPATRKFTGAWLVAIRFMLNATLVLMPCWYLAGIAENEWNTRQVILHCWYLCGAFAGSRLLMHPLLLGRFLSRLSSHTAMRIMGACLAVACNVLILVAVVPFLASFDNLGTMIFSIVIASFLLLVAALIANRLIEVLGRNYAREIKWRTMAVQGAKFLIDIGVIALVTTMWWRLSNSILRAPNAPVAVHEFMRLMGASVRALMRIWHHQLNSGMSVGSLTQGVIVFAFSFWVAGMARRMFHERVLARTPMDASTRLTFAAILGYIVIVTGFMVGLNVAGSSLQNLALLAGAITVGLGFGLQNVINNFVSSLLIHFGRTIRVGDFIEAAGARGIVREIGLRSTTVQTDDGVTVLIPNGAFISANITNWTNPSRRARMHVPVAILRSTDLAQVSALLIDTALGVPGVIADPAPILEVRGVVADKITLELLAWTDCPQRMPATIGELTLAVDRILRDKGILL